MNCNICGNDQFVPGFSGRLTFGEKPVCGECGSAERHRIVYGLFDKVKDQMKSWRLLQFAPDCSIDRGWFASYQGSVYGGDFSLDMMNTGLEEGSYEIILSNHVLEHIPDDTAALQEMLRVVGPKGLVALTAPTPIFRWTSTDWGFPDPEKNAHFRDYGADFPTIMTERIPDLHIMTVIGRDDVTGLHDHVYFLSRDPDLLAGFAKVWQPLGVPMVYVHR